MIYICILNTCEAPLVNFLVHLKLAITSAKKNNSAVANDIPHQR